MLKKIKKSLFLMTALLLAGCNFNTQQVPAAPEKEEEQKVPLLKLSADKTEFTDAIPSVTGGLLNVELQNGTASEVTLTCTDANISLASETVTLTDGKGTAAFTVFADSECTVTASVVIDEKEYTSSVDITAKLAAPAEGGLTINPVTPTSHEIPLTWTNDSSDYITYIIKYSWKDANPLITLNRKKIAAGPLTSYTIDDLIGSTAYSVEIWAVSAAKYTVTKASFTTDRDDIPPKAVSDISSESGQYEITLTWTNPTDRDVSKVVISTSAEGLEIPDVTVIPSGEQLHFDSNAVLTQKITGLKTNTTDGISYKFTLKTYDDQENHDDSCNVEYTAATLPDNTPPKSVSNIAVDFDTGTISYTDPDDEDLSVVKISNGTDEISVSKGVQSTKDLTFTKKTKLTFKTEDALGNLQESGVVVVIPSEYAEFADEDSLTTGYTGQLAAKLTVPSDEAEDIKYSFKLVSGSNESEWKKSSSMVLSGLEPGTEAVVSVVTKAELSNAVITRTCPDTLSATPVVVMKKMYLEYGSEEGNLHYLVNGYAAGETYKTSFFLNQSDSLYPAYEGESAWILYPGLADESDPSTVSFKSYRSGKWLAIDAATVYTKESSGTPTGNFDDNNSTNVLIIETEPEDAAGKSSATFVKTEAYDKASGYFSLVSYVNQEKYLREWWAQACLIEETSKLNDTPSCASWKFEDFEEPVINPVTDFAVSKKDSITATLTWTDPADCDYSYIVITADGKNRKNEDLSVKVLPGTGTATFRNLKAETEYTFTASVYNVFDKADSEAKVTVSTDADPKVPSVQGITVNTKYTGSMMVTWSDTIYFDEEAGITAADYSYKVKCVETGTEIAVDAGVEKAYFTGLTVGSGYTFQISSIYTPDGTVAWTSDATDSVKASKVIWHLLSGYTGGGTRYVSWVKSETLTTYDVGALLASDAKYGYWIVYPALSGNEDYFSLMASDENGVETAYYMYLDANERAMTNTGHQYVWNYGDPSTPILMAATLDGRENADTSYILENRKDASFKWEDSTVKSGYSILYDENQDKYMSHSSMTFGGKARGSTEDSNGCAAIKIDETITLEADEYAGAPEDVTELKAEPGKSSCILKWKNPSTADFDYVVISVSGTDADGNAIEDVSTTAETYTLSSLAEKTAYTFTVKTVDFMRNKSAAGVSVEASTQDKAIVKNVNAAAGYTGQAVVTWADTDADGTFTYRVVCNENGSYKDVAAGVQKAYFNNLTIGETYTFKVVTYQSGAPVQLTDGTYAEVAAADSVKAVKVIWHLLSGYGSGRYVEWIKNDTLTTYDIGALDAAATTENVKYAYWIAYPALSGVDGNCSLMATDETGIETAYYMYLDTNSRDRTNTGNIGVWNAAESKPFLMTATLDGRENSGTSYIRADRTDVSFKLKDSTVKTGYKVLNPEYENGKYDIRHYALTFYGKDNTASGYSEDVDGCAAVLIEKTTLDTDEYAGAPDEVTGAAATPDVYSCELTWSNPSNADFDHVVISVSGTDADGNAISDVKTSGTSYTFENLAADTSYSFTIKSVDYMGNASSGESVSTTTEPVPAAGSVTGLAYSNVINTSATLTWTDASDTAKVVITADAADRDSKDVTATVNAGTQTATFTNLKAETKYTFTVTAYNAYSVASETQTIEVTTASDPAAGASVTGIAYTTKYTGQIIVTWTDTTADGTYTYRVTAVPSTGDSIVKTGITAGTQKAVLNGLTAGTEYTVSVIAINSSDSLETITKMDSTAKAVKVLWHMLSGYTGGGTRYVSWVRSSTLTTYDVAAIGASDALYGYWLVYPALSGNEDYFSLMASDESGTETGYYMYLDANDRSMTNTTHAYVWNYGDPAKPILMVSTLSENYILDSRKDASFKWETSSWNSSYQILYDENKDYYMCHASMTFGGKARGTSEDGAGCAAMQVTESTLTE